MKKVLKLFLLFILLFPTIVLGKDVCNPNDIVIKNISISDTNGYAEENTPSSIDNNKIITDLKMYNVGDSIEYNIQVENTSDEDYYFNDKSIKKDTEYLEYSLVNSEELISAKTTKTVQLRVTYKNQIPNNSYEDTNKIEINVSDKPIENPETTAINTIIMIVLIFIIIMSYTKVVDQKNSKKSLILLLSLIGIIPLSTYAVCSVKLEIDSKVVITNKEATFDTGETVNIKMKTLAGSTSPTITTPDTNITSIKYSETEPIDSNKEEKNLVSTQDSEYPIYMWFDNGTIYWWSEDSHPNVNENANFYFLYLENLNNIESLARWDTSNSKKMNSMFAGDANLVSIDSLEKWDTSEVTSMQYMFGLNYKLASIDALKNWDVSKVTNMVRMFTKDYELEVADLSNWNTTSLTNMFGLFEMSDANNMPYLDAKLRKIILSDSFDTSKVTNMQTAFYCNTKLEDYDFVQYLDTQNVENMSMLFLDNFNLTDLNIIKHFDTSKVTNMQSLFYGCTGLTNLSGIENWDVSSVTNMCATFSECTNLKDISAISNWNVSSVTNYSNTFSDDINLVDASPIKDWNIQSTANFTEMFKNTPTHPEFTKVPGTWNNGTFIPS